QSLAARLDNVRFIPPQDEEFFPSVLAASDALLINQLPSVTDMSLPSKLTSYYSAGKPVIAAVADRSETAKVIAESGGGIVVDPSTPADFVAALSGLSAVPARAAELGANGTSYAASHLSAEAALTRLEQIIHGAHAQAAITMKGIPAV
ncbi:MAG: glycosyltransferase WbuB, partial [Thermomicrobiales bacterium]